MRRDASRVCVGAQVWTSTLARTIQTARQFPHSKRQWCAWSAGSPGPRPAAQASCALSPQRLAPPCCTHTVPLRRKALDEIDAGQCDGMTYREVEARMPDEFAARKRDKLGYR